MFDKPTSKAGLFNKYSILVDLILVSLKSDLDFEQTQLLPQRPHCFKHLIWRLEGQRSATKLPLGNDEFGHTV